jgi:hypothetical protein
MGKRSRTVTAVCSGLAALSVYSIIGYTTGAVPFPLESRGQLRAEELCGELGKRTRAAAVLSDILPAKGTYSSNGTHRGRLNDNWRSFCTVSSGSSVLLSGKAELGTWESTTTWLEDRRQYFPGDTPGAFRKFDAGLSGRTTEETARILVQCKAGTTAPGGGEQLNIVVHAHQPLQGTAKEKRLGLANVAVGVAGFAHAAAECSAPSALPATVNSVA